MTYSIENKYISICIDSRGAELRSLQRKKDQAQLLWQGDAQYWAEHSPILFPTVGNSYEQTIRHKGNTYPMPKHGLVRGMEFTRMEQTENKLILSVEDNEETRYHYPFHFQLSVVYALEETELKISFLVRNHSNEPLPFLLGAHPGFNLPQFDKRDGIHGFLGFDGIEKLVSLGLKPGGFAWREGTFDVPLNNGLLPLTNETFLCDTILDITSRPKACTLFNKEKNALLTVHFTSPTLAIWAPCGGCAPFVCIEPWWGLCDEDGYKGEFSQRPFANNVGTGETQCICYSIELH